MGELSTCSSLSYQKKLRFESHVNFHYPQKGHFTHSKLVIIDDKEIGIGSFNFHQKSISWNAETWVIIRNSPELIQEMKSHFEKRLNLSQSTRESENEYHLNSFKKNDIKRCRRYERLSPLIRRFI